MNLTAEEFIETQGINNSGFLRFAESGSKPLDEWRLDYSAWLNAGYIYSKYAA